MFCESVFMEDVRIEFTTNDPWSDDDEICSYRP